MHAPQQHWCTHICFVKLLVSYQKQKCRIAILLHTFKNWITVTGLYRDKQEEIELTATISCMMKALKCPTWPIQTPKCICTLLLKTWLKVSLNVHFRFCESCSPTESEWAYSVKCVNVSLSLSLSLSHWRCHSISIPWVSCSPHWKWKGLFS